MSSFVSVRSGLFVASILFLTPLLSTRLGAAPEVEAARQRYAKAPMSFEPNQGQTDSAVKYLSRGQGYTLYLTSTEMALQSPKHSNNPLRMKMIGGNAAAIAEPLDRLPGTTDYYPGNDPSKWLTHVPNYRRVALRSG
jgi:hypothetical protein